MKKIVFLMSLVAIPLFGAMLVEHEDNFLFDMKRGWLRFTQGQEEEDRANEAAVALVSPYAAKKSGAGVIDLAAARVKNAPLDDEGRAELTKLLYSDKKVGFISLAGDDALEELAEDREVQRQLFETEWTKEPEHYLLWKSAAYEYLKEPGAKLSITDAGSLIKE